MPMSSIFCNEKIKKNNNNFCYINSMRQSHNISIFFFILYLKNKLKFIYKLFFLIWSFIASFILFVYFLLFFSFLLNPNVFLLFCLLMVKFNELWTCGQNLRKHQKRVINGFCGTDQRYQTST